MNNKNMNVIMKFYNKQFEMNIPEKYDSFQASISSFFEFPLSNFKELIISYIDIDNDTILISNKGDFEELIKQLKRNEIKEISIKVIEGSKIQFPSQKKIEAEILLSDIQQDKVASKPKEKPLKVEQKPQLINPNQIYELNQPKRIESYEINQIFNLNPNVIQNDIIFDIPCSICHKTPIKILIYLCEQCNMYLCSECEGTHGPSHRHPFLKIRNPALIEGNKQQNKKDELKKVIIEEKKEKNIFDSIMKIPDTIKNWFKDEGEGQDPDYLIKVARANYDLTNITNEELLKAINQTKGNIDEAVILLIK